jgi:hypothetical protein
MARQSIIVIDDFYEDPEAIRRTALGLAWKRYPGATYPGRQAQSDHDWSAVRSRLRAYIEEAVDAPNPKPYDAPPGLFRLALAEDEASRLDGVHQDAQRWSAVIYLSRPEDCRGGVAFFRHRETGLVASTRELEASLFGHLAGARPDHARREVLAYLRDLRHWEQIGQVPMAYNRAVLLMAQCFHMSMGIFGTTPENGRLTQHFEFYAANDGHVYGDDSTTQESAR